MNLQLENKNKIKHLIQSLSYLFKGKDNVQLYKFGNNIKFATTDESSDVNQVLTVDAGYFDAFEVDSNNVCYLLTSKILVSFNNVSDIKSLMFSIEYNPDIDDEEAMLTILTYTGLYFQTSKYKLDVTEISEKEVPDTFDPDTSTNLINAVPKELSFLKSLCKKILKSTNINMKFFSTKVDFRRSDNDTEYLSFGMDNFEGYLQYLITEENDEQNVSSQPISLKRVPLRFILSINKLAENLKSNIKIRLIVESEKYGNEVVLNGTLQVIAGNKDFIIQAQYDKIDCSLINSDVEGSAGNFVNASFEESKLTSGIKSANINTLKSNDKQVYSNFVNEIPEADENENSKEKEEDIVDFNKIDNTGEEDEFYKEIEDVNYF